MTTVLQTSPSRKPSLSYRDRIKNKNLNEFLKVHEQKRDDQEESKEFNKEPGSV